MDTQLADRIIDHLNDAVLHDRDAMEFLMRFYTPCNESLAKHPTIQVKRYEDNSHTVGWLGVINGLCGVDENGCGLIAAYIDENDKLIKFGRYVPS